MEQGGKERKLFGFIPIPEMPKGSEKWLKYGLIGTALVIAAGAIL